MKLNHIAVLAGILTVPCALGQNVKTFEIKSDAVTVGGASIEGFDGKVITGSPYTAKAVTTVTQTLGDGNHITNTTEVLLARDSQGRTRREQKLNSIGPWTTGEKGSMVTINDPVAQYNLVLMPDGQTAMKTPSAGAMTFTRHIDAGTTFEHAMPVPDGGPSHTMVFVAGGEPGDVMYRSGEVMHSKMSMSKAQPEDLGEQVIEGVRAKGQRVKNVIPAGKMGNERPIEMVSETWYSPDLQTVVLSKRSDPRMGDTEYRLTNIQRVEPAPSLFTLPAGYTIREERMRD